MSYLPKNPLRFFIVKVSGDNNGDKQHHFIVDNKAWDSFSEACDRCKALATQTPGNRYYVVRMRAGFMAHEPRLETAYYTTYRTDEDR